MSRLSLLVLALISVFAVAGSTTVGVTYNPSERDPSPEEIVNILKSLNISAVRITSPSIVLMEELEKIEISVFVVIPNKQIPAMAANRSFAGEWIDNHVLRFSRVTYISVGDNALSDEADTKYGELLLSALKNVELAIATHPDLHVKVSVSFDFESIITMPMMPSSAKLNNYHILRPILVELRRMQSPLFVSLHPFFFLRKHSVSLHLALFQADSRKIDNNECIVDQANLNRYGNLFDIMFDGVIRALTFEGFDNIEVAVTETGWPFNIYDDNHVIASKQNSKLYNQGLIDHVLSGVGTPIRRNGAYAVFVYELFGRFGDNNQIDTDWGLFYHNGTKKYEIDFYKSTASKKETDKISVLMILTSVALCVVFTRFLYRFFFERDTKRKVSGDPLSTV